MKPDTSALVSAVLGVVLAASEAHAQHCSHPAAAEDRSQQAPARSQAEQADPGQAGHSEIGANRSFAPVQTETRHSGMDHSKMDHSKMDHSKMDHSRMDHSRMDHSRMDHSRMDHSRMGHSEMEQGGAGDTARPSLPAAFDQPPPTGLPVPPATDADRAAAFPNLHGHTTHDRRVVSFVQFTRLEAWEEHGEAGQAWEGHAWVGTDHHKLWLRSEGEREHGETASADLEVLYGRPIAAWWDVVAGVRHDFQPGGGQTFAALGLMGLAPYKFEVQATAYIGESGQTAARVEAEYETLLTNRLILQSLVEATLYGRDDERRGVGSGLSTVEAGIRLRYELSRRFAPYAGVTWERAYGGTAGLRRHENEARESAHLVAGVRFWF